MNFINKEKKLSILVLGSSGQLGQSFKFCNMFNSFNFIFLTKNELDMENSNLISKKLEKYKFDIMINCSAYTNVEMAEKDYKKANCINAISVNEISKFIKMNNKLLIHISTDYVFDGNKDSAYLENDMTKPISKYGLSKLNGEKSIINSKSNSLIIRTSWLFSEFRENFVKKIISASNDKNFLTVVDDEISAPTYSIDLANFLLTICSNYTFLNSVKKTQIFHYCNDGFVSRYEFAKKIIENLKIQCNVKPISSELFNSSVKRPKYSLLNNSKAKKIFKINIRSWEDSLIECINNIKKIYE